MKPAVLLACAAALAATTAHAGCPAGAPTGYYEGEAASADIGKVSATLDLVCEDGAYHVRLFTGMGEFAVKDIKAETGKASFAIDTGPSLGQVQLAGSDGELSGAVTDRVLARPAIK
jgi:hypothetical protein